MPKFEDEITLSVSDYYHGDSEEAFILCENAIDDAKNQFMEEAKSGEINATIVDVEFVEFDSGNYTHASGYFLVTYYAEKSIYPEEE